MRVLILSLLIMLSPALAVASEGSNYEDFKKCSYCNHEESESHPLLKCSSCKVAKYCNQGCQKSNWKKHKRICSLLKSSREDLDKISEILEKKDGVELVESEFVGYSEYIDLQIKSRVKPWLNGFNLRIGNEFFTKFEESKDSYLRYTPQFILLSLFDREISLASSEKLGKIFDTIQLISSSQMLVVTAEEIMEMLDAMNADAA